MSLPSSAHQNGVVISNGTPDGTPTTTLSMSSEHIDAIPGIPLPPAAPIANRPSNSNVVWTSTLAPAATVTTSNALSSTQNTTTSSTTTTTTPSADKLVKSSTSTEQSSVRFAPPPIVRTNSTEASSRSLSRQSSLSIDTEDPTGPTLASTTTTATRAVDDKKQEPAAPASAFAAILPDIHSPHDAFLFVWRLADTYVMYWRPLLVPLIAWLIGRFGLSIVFAVALTFVWYYAVKNGHLLPRPPPSAEQVKAEADRLAAVALLSPTTPSPTTTSSPFQVADANPGQGYGPTGMASLATMLTGLTVKYPDWVFYPDVERTKW